MCRFVITSRIFDEIWRLLVISKAETILYTNATLDLPINWKVRYNSVLMFAQQGEKVSSSIISPFIYVLLLLFMYYILCYYLTSIFNWTPALPHKTILLTASLGRTLFNGTSTINTDSYYAVCYQQITIVSEHVLIYDIYSRMK